MRPVAQKAQVRLHPTWVLTHTVNRSSSGTGISTLSILYPSCVIHRDLTVPSALCWVLSSWRVLKVNCSRSFARRSLDRLLMDSKSAALLLHSHSYSCLARKRGSPHTWNSASTSARESERISFFTGTGPAFSAILSMHN